MSTTANRFTSFNMELTKWEKDNYQRIHPNLQGQNVKELRALLDMADILDTELDEGETLEVDDDIMKICWRVASRFGPQFPQDERAIRFLEKLETL